MHPYYTRKVLMAQKLRNQIALPFIVLQIPYNCGVMIPSNNLCHWIREDACSLTVLFLGKPLHPCSPATLGRYSQTFRVLIPRKNGPRCLVPTREHPREFPCRGSMDSLLCTCRTMPQESLTGGFQEHAFHVTVRESHGVLRSMPANVCFGFRPLKPCKHWGPNSAREWPWMTPVSTSQSDQLYWVGHISIQLIPPQKGCVYVAVQTILHRASTRTTV